MNKIKFEPAKLGEVEIVTCHYDLRKDTTPMDKFQLAYLHNTYKHTDLSDLLDFHLSVGFSGIGYHFAIAPDGTIYNTRPLEVQGAHVYGRNTDSVGIVLLDVDKCAASTVARRSLIQLYKELQQRSGDGLPLLPHTLGQFDYLNQLIAIFNEGLNGLSFPLVDYNEQVCSEEGLRLKKAEIVDQIIARRRKGIPEPKREQFAKIVWMEDKLKICPGREYFTFMQEIRGQHDEA